MECERLELKWLIQNHERSAAGQNQHRKWTRVSKDLFTEVPSDLRCSRIWLHRRLCRLNWYWKDDHPVLVWVFPVFTGYCSHSILETFLSFPRWEPNPTQQYCCIVATINKILSVEAEPRLTDVKGSICYFLRKSNCNLTHRSALLPPRKEPPPAAKHSTAKPQSAMFSLQNTPGCTGPLTAGQFALLLSCIQMTETNFGSLIRFEGI